LTTNIQRANEVKPTLANAMYFLAKLAMTDPDLAVDLNSVINDAEAKIAKLKAQLKAARESK